MNRFTGAPVARQKRVPSWLSRTDQGESRRGVWPPQMSRSLSPSAPPRVLVVEDDAAFRGLVSRVLSDAGYDVSEACDGADLLESVADAATRDGVDLHPFAAIVTDVRMPGISGTDAIELLRSGPWRHTPVIVMTAFTDSQTRARANRLGAAAVLEKPFDADRLCSALREVVAPS